MNPLNEPPLSRRFTRAMGTLAIAALASAPGLAGAHPGHDGDEGADGANHAEDNSKLAKDTRDTVLTVAAFPFRVLSTIVTGGETTSKRARGTKSRAKARASDEESESRGVEATAKRFDEKIGPSESPRSRTRTGKSNDDYENLVNAATDTIKLLVTLPFKALSYAASVRDETDAADVGAKEEAQEVEEATPRSKSAPKLNSAAKSKSTAGGNARNPRPARRSSNAVTKTSDHIGGAAEGIVDETGDVTYSVIRGVWNAAKATLGTIANVSARTFEDGRARAGKELREAEANDDRDDIEADDDGNNDENADKR